VRWEMKPDFDDS